MNEFSIKDLESFSGIKAHTIRIWEQRYELLNPSRTVSNIRIYSNEDLKRLLNVTYLYNKGYKISRIAEMTMEQVNALIDSEITAGKDESHYLNVLKIAMLNFDESLFYGVVDKYLLNHKLEDLYLRIFLPFLDQIGVLWQSNSVCPAEEHFIAHLIRQKMMALTDDFSGKSRISAPIYVLYLPENERHEIGLIFLNYLLKSKGYRTAYLGSDLPVKDLKRVAERLGSVEFVSIFTVAPAQQAVLSYINLLAENFSAPVRFHLSGKLLKKHLGVLPDHVRAYANVGAMVEALIP